jgi:hypothetical protein
MESASNFNISSHPRLSSVHKAALKKGELNAGVFMPFTSEITGGFTHVSDILLCAPERLGEKCKLSTLEAQRMLDEVMRECVLSINCLQDTAKGDEKCTTGDADLDDALGGGIRTGMIWEVVGERFAICIAIRHA